MGFSLAAKLALSFALDGDGINLAQKKQNRKLFVFSVCARKDTNVSTERTWKQRKTEVER